MRMDEIGGELLIQTIKDRFTQMNCVEGCSKEDKS